MRRAIIRFMNKNAVALLHKRVTEYDRILDDSEIRSCQLNSFNSAWARARKLPFYEWWSAQHRLPSRLHSIEGLADFPVLTKKILVDQRDLVFEGLEPANFYTTGGSTGEPTRYPKGAGDYDGVWANSHLGRRWVGIQPGDRYVHIWGHSHLFGQGRQANRIRAVRRAKDWLAGGLRLDAYDQSVSTLQDYVEKILRYNPKFVIGYTSALRALADVILDAEVPLAFRHLQTVVATAETATEEDLRVIQSAFRVPVSLEYGAAETGLIAHTPTMGASGFRVAWQSIAANADEDGLLKVTTLDQREFPLINYVLGDRVEFGGPRESILKFDRVLGREKDIVEVALKNGLFAKLNMISVAQILKSQDGVRTVQAHQASRLHLRVYITTGPGVSVDERYLSNLLAIELHRSFRSPIRTDTLEVRVVNEPIRAKSGKLTLMLPSMPDFP